MSTRGPNVDQRTALPLRGLRRFGTLAIVACLALGAHARLEAQDDRPQDSIGTSAAASAPAAGTPVVDVKIVGNRQVSEGKIFRQLQTRAGVNYNPDVVGEDVRRLVSNLHFIDVKTQFVEVPGGVIVTYKVVERPVLESVTFLGNTNMKSDKLLKETGLEVGSALDLVQIGEGRRKLLELYKSKGFNHVEITIQEGNEPSHRRAVYAVYEGPQQVVRQVNFVGNKIVTAGRLRTLLQTKKPIAWFFGGKFNPENLDADVDKLVSYYHALGYWDVRIGREVDMNEKGDAIRVTFVIDDGALFKVRNISIVGNKKFETSELMGLVKLQGNQFFDQPSLQKDITAVKNLYGSQGYVYCDVRADARFLEDSGLLDLVFQIEEGARYRVGKVEVAIGGENPHTKITAVLNRVSLRPGDVVDTRELNKSERRIKASGLFRNDPQRNIAPKIVYTPAEMEALAALPDDGPSRSRGPRGQSPDDQRPAALSGSLVAPRNWWNLDSFDIRFHSESYDQR
jgi:outer membrane protein insertion porin family